jgi:site-specific DNA-cytosine methylase
MAGVNVVLGVDRNSAALDTFSRLHPFAMTSDRECGDITSLRAATKTALGRDVDLDIVTASPPCTCWSSATSPAAAHTADAEQLLLTAHAIVALSPRVAIVENVPRARGSLEWATMRTVLAMAGCHLEETVLDSAKLGVPQRRRRVFLAATRGVRPLGLANAAAKVAQHTDTTLAQMFPNDSFPATATAHWHYGRYPADSCIRSMDLPSPTLRSNCGYYPHSGTYTNWSVDKFGDWQAHRWRDPVPDEFECSVAASASNTGDTGGDDDILPRHAGRATIGSDHANM